jgi:hypothetical protein
MNLNHRLWMLPAAALCLLAALPLLSTPQTQLASSSIEGVVVKLGSTEPVVGAVVELAWRPVTSTAPGGAPPPPNAPPQVRTVTTGDDGKFAFRNLPANEYRLVATRPGGTYNPAQYGQRDPRSQGTPLTLALGEAKKDVRLEMAVTGTITGRVYDRNGEPMAYTRVLAMQAWYHEGNRLLDFVQVVHTNDRGEYRLFWLPPGRYFVAARPEADGIAGATNFVNTPDRVGQFHEEVSTIPPITRVIQDNEIVSETYELTFYGGQTNPLRAQAIDVRPGMTVPGIDIPLAAGTVRPRTIKGIVIDGATGQPAAGATISALPKIFLAASRVAPAGTADANGRFTIRGLTTEAYILHFRTAGNLYGFHRLESGTGDIENLSLVAKPGVPITGKISFDGRPPSDNDPDIARLAIQIVQDPGIPGVPTPPGVPVLPNGTFSLPSLFPIGWDFEVYVGGTRPPGTYVKSIKLGPHDVLNSKYYPEPGESQRGGLQVPGPLDQPLEIVLGIGTGTIEGRATDARQQIAPYRTVVLLPDVPLRHRFDLHRITQTDTSGKYRFQNVTPGAYKIFAFDQIDVGAWEDATFMQGYEGGGQQIRVLENSQQTLDLKVIP